MPSFFFAGVYWFTVSNQTSAAKIQTLHFHQKIPQDQAITIHNIFAFAYIFPFPGAVSWMTKSRHLGIIVGCNGANYPTNWVSSFMEGFFSTGCAFPPWDHSLDQRARKSWEVYCNSWRSAEDRVFGHILLRSMYATIVLLDMIASSKRRRPWHLFVAQAVRSCYKKRLPNY